MASKSLSFHPQELMANLCLAGMSNLHISVFPVWLIPSPLAQVQRGFVHLLCSLPLLFLLDHHSMDHLCSPLVEQAIHPSHPPQKSESLSCGIICKIWVQELISGGLWPIMRTFQTLSGTYGSVTDPRGPSGILPDF